MDKKQHIPVFLPRIFGPGYYISPPRNSSSYLPIGFQARPSQRRLRNVCRLFVMKASRHQNKVRVGVGVGGGLNATHPKNYCPANCSGSTFYLPL